MTSNINFQDIDETFPVSGLDQPSQGFRDNFGVIKLSLNAAKEEVEELQDYVSQLPTTDNVNSIIATYNYVTISNVEAFLTAQEYLNKSNLSENFESGAGISISTDADVLTFSVLNELTTSILSDDETLLVDSINGLLTGPLNSFDNVNRISMDNGGIQIFSSENIEIFGEDESPINIGGYDSGDVYLGNGINQIRFNSAINTEDSSALTIVPMAVFESNVIIENELFVNNIPGYIKVDTLKSIVSSSSDFENFKSKIAAL
jgi:hypothetical protein